MRNQFLKSLVVILCGIGFFTEAQEDKENDTINTQVVNVVKPYTPKISDAFKVKETPTLQDSATTAKKDVKYNIFSIPVASTFTPSKGKAAPVEKQKKERLFDNYVSGALGSYTSILGELYLNYAIDRTQSAGGYLSHHSSQGGIENARLDNDFSDTQLRVNYGMSLRDMAWKVDAGYMRQTFNWYGVPESLTNEEITGIDPKHIYNSFDFGAEIEFDDLFLNGGSMRFRRFADDYDSGENHFMLKTEIDFPIRDELINTNFRFEYLGGGFDRSYFVDEELNYGNIIFGVNPSYQMIEDDLTLNLGLSINYLHDREASDSKFYIFPNITASYKLVKDVLIPYGGITGDIIQNTYYNFTQENPFVSPTLLIVPTEQTYNAFIGLKGKLSNNVSYNVRGNYYAENDKALFKNNTIATVSTLNNYNRGNSFNVVYDDVSTFSVFGEINVDVNRNFNLGIKAEYFTYNTDDESEAWNLPDFKGSLFLDYQIDEHWFAGANLYYIGERKDQQTLEATLIPEDLRTTITLDSYFDANAHVGYRINDRWTAYIRANNIANQDYNRWLNFPVQGIQFLGGVTYKFNF